MPLLLLAPRERRQLVLVQELFYRAVELPARWAVGRNGRGLGGHVLSWGSSGSGSTVVSGRGRAIGARPLRRSVVVCNAASVRARCTPTWSRRTRGSPLRPSRAPARLLVAAERLRRVEDVVGVDPHRSGPQLRDQAMSLGQVVGPRAGGEAIHGLVGGGSDLVGALERDRGADRAEDLLVL